MCFTARQIRYVYIAIQQHHVSTTFPTNLFNRWDSDQTSVSHYYSLCGYVCLLLSTEANQHRSSLVFCMIIASRDLSLSSESKGHFGEICRFSFLQKTTTACVYFMWINKIRCGDEIQKKFPMIIHPAHSVLCFIVVCHQSPLHIAQLHRSHSHNPEWYG